MIDIFKILNKCRVEREKYQEKKEDVLKQQNTCIDMFAKGKGKGKKHLLEAGGMLEKRDPTK